MRTARLGDPAHTTRSSFGGVLGSAVGASPIRAGGGGPAARTGRRQAPDYGGVPGGAFELGPWPMSGQFLVEPEPELEFEPEPVDELEEPEPVLPTPDLDDGVVEGLAVEEFDVELVPVFPELPVVVDVVAASATNAPPAIRPDVSAPVARTLRRRICMGVPLLSVGAGPFEPVLPGCAPDLSAAAEGHGWVRGVVRRMDDDSQQWRRRCTEEQVPA